MSSSHPHVILLMADQLRADCISCYGDLNVRTPHLDALSQESVVYSRAYCSTPLCIPTRTSLATGMWPHSTGVIVNGGNYEAEIPHRTLGPEHRTYYEHFLDQGYRIVHVGVQHVNSNPLLEQRAPGADINGFTPYLDNLRNRGYELPFKTLTKHPTPEFNNGRIVVKMYESPMAMRRVDCPPEHFTDIYWADRMVEKIAAADASKPTLWIFQLWAPHPPFFAPEPYFSMYDPASVNLPANVAQWYDGMPGTLLHGTGGRGAPFEADDWRKTWAVYFGMVTMVDDCMGKVVRAFKDKGIWNNALALFTMDHGDHLGSHSLFQKMSLYEESARVPLFVKPPKGETMAAGRRDQPVGHVDLAPTFCDYAGIGAMPGMWGRSLRGLTADAKSPWREATFCEFNGDHGRGFPARGIIDSRYKYIHHFCADPELYDLQADPLETRSLAKDPAHQDRCARMRAQLTAWMRETGDMLDIDRDVDFHPGRWRNHRRDGSWVAE